MNQFLLDFLSIAAILSGILVITSKNPVISVLFLISVFVNVAGYLVLLGVGFIGISYLIVYVGAIAILFLFVIIMLNLQLTELTAAGKEYTQNLPLGGILAFLFLSEMVSLLPNQTLLSLTKDLGLFSSNSKNIGLSNSLLTENEPTGAFSIFHSIFHFSNYDQSNFVAITFNPENVDIFISNFQQIQSIATILYTNGTIWLILASVILLLAIVGPITLSIKESNVLYFPKSQGIDGYYYRIANS